MEKLKQLIESLSKIPKAMQWPIGIGVAISIIIGVFFWSGGNRIFDSIDNANNYNCEKRISDSLSVTKREFYKRLSKKKKTIDSLKSLINSNNLQP